MALDINQLAAFGGQGYDIDPLTGKMIPKVAQGGLGPASGWGPLPDPRGLVPAPDQGSPQAPQVSPPQVPNQGSISPEVTPPTMSDFLRSPVSSAADWFRSKGNPNNTFANQTPPTLPPGLSSVPQQAPPQQDAPPAPAQMPDRPTREDVPQALPGSGPGPVGPTAGPPAAAPTVPPQGPMARPETPQSPPGDLKSFLQRVEGYNPNAYSDFKQTSIGYGSKASGPDEKIDHAEALVRLDRDIATHQGVVDAAAKANGVTLNPNQRDALTSFDFNVGKAGEVLQRAGGDMGKVPALMAEYNQAGGRVNAGLVSRRAEEGGMFNGTGNVQLSPQAPAAAPPPPAAPAAGVPASLPGTGPQSFDPRMLQATSGDKLLALASGLMSGPNFGQGMGKGLAALNAMNATDRENVLKGISMQNQTAQLGLRMADTTSKINSRTDNLAARNLSTAQRYDIQTQAMKLRASGQDMAAQRLEDQLGGGKVIRADNVKADAGYGTEVEHALATKNTADNLLGVLSSGTVSSSGPDFESRLKTFITNITGAPLDSDTRSASGQALYQKLASQLGTQAAMESTGGKMPRANAELQAFLKGAPGTGMNLDALRAITEKVAAEAGAKIDGYNAYQSSPETKDTALHDLGGVQAYQNGVMQKFYQNSPHFNRPPAPAGASQAPFVYGHGENAITIR